MVAFCPFHFRMPVRNICILKRGAYELLGMRRQRLEPWASHVDLLRGPCCGLGLSQDSFIKQFTLNHRGLSIIIEGITVS